MNRPAFSQWATESNQKVATESFASMYGGLKSLFGFGKKKKDETPAKQQQHEREVLDYTKKLMELVSSQYANSAWLSQQTFVTEPIEVGNLNFLFDIKNKQIKDILSQVEHDAAVVKKITLDYIAQKKIWNKKVKSLYSRLQKLAKSKQWDSDDEISATPEFKAISNEFDQLPNPLSQMNIHSYKLTCFEAEKDSDGIEVLEDKKLPEISYQMNPLTKNEIIKAASLIALLFFDCNEIEFADKYDYRDLDDLGDAEMAWEDFGGGIDDGGDVMLLVFNMASDGYISKHDDIFHAYMGVNLIERLFDLAYGLEAIMSRSIK